MNNLTPLPRSFYKPPADVVARKLLGHWLIRISPEGACGGPIVEVEAYLSDDPACHGAVGPTKRNRVMFGPPGYAYVYFIYGCHFCVNAVCRPAGIAEAVLIRAVEPLFGENIMRSRRRVPARPALTNGPAKLCEGMGIDSALAASDLCDAGSALFIARNPSLAQFRKQRGPVVTTVRIGITQAAALPLRFYLSNSPFVSSGAKGAKAAGKQAILRRRGQPAPA